MSAVRWGAAVAAAVAVPALISACRAVRPEVGPAAETCTEGGAPLTPASGADGLAGRFRLRLAATTGPRAGAATDGRLALAPIADSSLAPVLILGLPDSTTTFRLAGTAEIDPAAVGAARTGDLTSPDPAAPGVLVIQRRPKTPEAPVELTLRLGADANRRGVTRFDGGYFALRVRRSGPAGFAGTWASGGTGERAEGTFCAVRAAS